MYNLKIGDLVAIKHPYSDTYLKKGIIISESSNDITVKWFSYDKNFFMEKKDDLFSELNKKYLLSYQTINRYQLDSYLLLLNSS